jgi:hypothetical protein
VGVAVGVALVMVTGTATAVRKLLTDSVVHPVRLNRKTTIHASSLIFIASNLLCSQPWEVRVGLPASHDAPPV